VPGAIVVGVHAAEDRVAALRERHDASARLGMQAHVTLLVPFAAAPADPAMLGDLARLFAGFEPFDVRFGSVGRFERTVYLVPEPAAPFIAMTRALAAAFPAYPPYGGAHADVVPHLTVADGDAARAAEVAADLDAQFAALGPIETRIRSAQWVDDASGRWRTAHRFALGASPEPAAPPAPRMHMTVALRRRAAVALDGLRAPRADDAPDLARLMLDAYRGSVDDEGGSLADAADEIRKTQAGAYGDYLPDCSRVVERDGALASALLVTRWRGRPFVAYAMTAPAFKRKGLARAALIDAMHALLARGETLLSLVVTIENRAAADLYRELGFVEGR